MKLFPHCRQKSSFPVPVTITCFLICFLMSRVYSAGYSFSCQLGWSFLFLLVYGLQRQFSAFHFKVLPMPELTSGNFRQPQMFRCQAVHLLSSVWEAPSLSPGLDAVESGWGAWDREVNTACLFCILNYMKSTRTAHKCKAQWTEGKLRKSWTSKCPVMSEHLLLLFKWPLCSVLFW